MLSIYRRTSLFNYLILFLGLAVCLTSGWLVARYLGKPIEALIEGADQLVKSNYDHRINLKRKDELGRLISAFNQMAGTIRQDMAELGSKNRQLLKAREDLEKERDLIKNIFAATPDAVFITDLSGNFTEVNGKAIELLGLNSRDELMGQNFSAFIAPDDRDLALRNFQKTLDHEELIDVPLNAVNAKNERFPLEYSASLLPGIEGRPANIVMVGRNIAWRRKAELAMAESEARFRLLAEASPASIFAYREKFIYVNPACQALTGYSPAESLDLNFWDLIHPDYRDLVKQRGLARQRGENVPANYEFKIIRKDGQARWVNFAGILTQFGGQQSGLGMALDITERKEAERKLAETEMKYQQVLEGMAEGIYRTTPEGKILLANQAIVKMLGFASLDELMARDIQKEGYFDPNMRRKFVEEMSQKGQVNNWINEWRKKDGSILVVRENAHAVKDLSGKIIYYEGTVEDITEQRLAERKLAESERKYSQLFEGIVEGIYRTTPEGKVLLANPALVKMLGFESLEQVIKLDLNKSGYMDVNTRRRFKELMERDGQALGFEARWKRPDGKILIISENARAVRDGQGNVTCYEGTIEDITERQQAEEALLNEKNKLSDLFRVSLQVARAGGIQKKLDLTMEGIAGTGLFARAALVLKNEEGGNSHIAHFGMTNKEAQAILRAAPAKAEKLEKIFNKKYRYSNSYFIPHDAPGVDFSIKLINKRYQPSGDWHPADVLLVPLTVKEKHIGYLTVDEPVDGKIPGLETVRLLELFANQAAVAVDNFRLYSDLERSYYSTLKAFVAAMDAKDPYTKGHSENVRYHALNIARQLKLPEEQVKLIDFSSLLHDIGKLAIRDEILTKPSLLSDHEYQEVKLHPVIGSHLVAEVESLLHLAPIIHSHHEHYDGSGYPQGIKGDDIPLEARIIAVADAFEAMTSDRPYRKAFDLKVAINRLQEAAGAQFDEEIVKTFIKLHQETHG
ncbi:PAS domain S-box protein [candidate division TA06 bacterium]|uniref:PAS domain S-box protein n=1 Tax=candidate division TA06 bacterium TaxID=2250710 RepID=A0A933IB37_UNCT6|nr:PAS domain S-box protein [candidate division TA06 bacterium]